ncbi:retrotransposon protein, putative, ty1-copia subclass, partial [Tanacetum coccineum]
MTGTKFDIEKFDGTGDFELWRIKMRALLIQHGCEAALEVTRFEWGLREVTGETTAAGVWTKLETLYMTKSLANKLYLKKKLYTFYMSAGRKISEHIDEFNKIVLDLANIEDVMATLFKRKTKERSRGEGDDGEGLYVRGRTDRRDSRCSYQSMTPRLDILFDFLECDGGSVQLGDNRECKIRGIGKSGKIKVINGSRVVLSRTQRDNYVYSLDGHVVAGELNASVEEKDSLAQVWHIRLGHIGKAGLQVLEKQGLFGKKSLGGIIGRKELVENQTGRTVKKMRTDNGLEFCNREFEQLCIESRIARHLTVAETPQQNGLAERMNRILMDKVCFLLIQSGLPKTFWTEATCTAAYLINRSPSTTIEKKTLMEMWSGHPSDYGVLRIFSCVAYSHVKQGKLELRAINCVLLGNPEGVKGQELQVEVELQRLNNHTLEEDQTDQEDGDDEDAGDQETDQTPDLTDYQLVRDREPRTRTKPLRFRDESNMAAYAFVAAEEEDTHEPLTYQEAVACEDSSKWKAAMKEEMDSLRKNKTWELVDHPAGQKLVSCKWLFKIKEGIEGVQKPRYKARLVARGFTQRAGIDYNEVFSLVVRHTSIRVILALTACKDYELEQLDVKTTFLHGNLEEVIYIRQPPGYEQGNKVCLLNKSLYSLKQSPRQWSYAPGEYIYLLLYVDDMLIACKSKAEIGSAKSLLKKEFDMKELGEAKKILGMEIVRDRSRKILRVSQSGYVSKILNNFRIDNGKSVQMPLGGHFKLSLKDCPVRDCDVERMSKVPYANAVGSLMYLMVCTRPDIAYAVSVVSRYLANPGKNHWEAVKWILKYLRGTANVSLVYGTDRGNHVDVTGFVDSDYAKDPDKGRSITGYAFLVQRCVVSWKATLQHVVALSTTEAEYMALTEAVKEAIWLRGLLEELGVELNTVAVNCDNQGAIHLSRNHIFHERTKHINVRYHFIREVLEAKTVEVLKVGTEHNAADALTKVVPGHKLQHCLELLSIAVIEPSQPIPKTLNHQTSPRFNSRTHHSAMTNSNTPPPPPALTLVEKLYAVHNINSLVPEKLDLQESNYSTWSYFFKGHCSNFNVLNHIDGSTSTSDPPTDEWITADSIVKSWIFLTLSPTLRKRMISTNPASAKAAWDTIETIFQENKRTRTVALKGELRVIQMGDDTPDAYFSKIDSIITLLTDLGSTMDDDDIVTYAINGLSEKYGSLAQIIAHKDPFPDLATVRTMVTTEEMRLRSKQPILSTSTTSSSPQVLLATSQPRIQDNRNNRDRDARNENKTEICRNFGRGYCRWGTNCRFIHASPKGTNNPRPNSSQHNTRSMQQGPGHTGLNSASQQHLLSLIQAQQNLLAQYGLSISQGQQPVQHNNTMGLRPNAPPGFQQTQPHQPTFGFNGHQQALYSAAVQNQSASSGSTSQETQLPHAFNTLTLQDPANSNWNMDTGASSHLNSSVNNLSTIFNSRIYPSVLVGDGKSIPVTNTGHSTLPTPYRTLHLNNVLITPNIVKNLISVRQFVRENKCTIEFDEFGFSVKDFWTRQILLRCDSTGDLYPVTSLSYPQAFLVGQQTWHQRLGHPGSELGKHVRLPFSLSETIVKAPFDIIHSDLWTSPLTSVSGIKYYVLFLDHFSHYLWVYPLRHKSDVLSKFIHFRAYVKNHFNCDIKSLQCDHGGEFDNTALHQLFVTNGISIRFSCPKTSQQNGKSERMIRTINNMIRTLLFQAHLPPTFWVEALHMAAYLLNILPSTAINNEIPHTRLFKTTPNYADLRVFGCLCYPHLHTNHKLEPRATPAIFLGYPTNHRGYRCLDLNTNKIILSRHVTFDETVFPYGSMTPHDSPSYTFLDTSPNIIHQHIISKLTSASPLPTTTITSTAAPPSPPRSPLQPAHQTHESSPLPHSPNVQPTSNASTETTIPTHNHNNPTSTHPMVTRFRV